MHQQHLLRLLFIPSVMSAVTVIVVAAALLITANVSYFLHDSLIYEYLFSPHGQVSILQDSTSTLGAVFDTVSAQPLTYNIVVLVGALIVGFLVYGVLQVMSHGLASVVSTLLNFRFARSTDTKIKMELELGSRIGIRIATAIIWVFYWLFSAKFILPFCVLAGRVGVGELDTAEGWFYCLLSYVLLVLSLHLHIILIRLFALRPRIFGGNDVMIAILEDR